MAHRCLTVAVTGLLIALPVAAQAAAMVPLPQPADFALFGLGVAGLLIGRKSSRARRRD